MTVAKILVAVWTEPLPTVMSALDGYELLVAKDVEHAQHLSRENSDIDLFVISILFDDSKAMELIKTIRMDKAEVPIVVTRFIPALHEDMLKNVMLTMQSLGTVNEYFEREFHAPDVQSEIRAVVERHLPEGKRVARASR